MEPSTPWEEQKKQIEQLLQRKLKRLSKAKEQWKQELLRNVKWEETLHVAELLKANYGAFSSEKEEMEVWDWKTDALRCLIRSKTSSWKECMEEHFKKARKQRASLLPIQKHLQRLQDVEQTLLKQLESVVEIASLEELIPLLPLLETNFSSPSRENKPEKKDWWTFWTKKGEAIWVGRNAMGNEKLTFTHAHGKDIWLHIVGESGSHVVLRPLSGLALDFNSLEEAMQLALYYSKYRNRGEGEVLWTERKEVHRPKKKTTTGLVEVRVFRSKKIRLDPEQIRAIQGRQQPRDRPRKSIH